MSLLEKLEEQIKSGEFLLENARNDLQGCEGIQKFETKVFFTIVFLAHLFTHEYFFSKNWNDFDR